MGSSFYDRLAWISKLLHDAAFTWRPRELSCWLKKYATYFGEFGYLNSSCIRNGIISMIFSSSRDKFTFLKQNSVTDVSVVPDGHRHGVSMCAFHSTKNSGLNFPNFRMSNGTVFSTRPNRSCSIPAWAHFPPRITTVLLDKMLKDRKLLHVEKFNTHSEFNSSLIFIQFFPWSFFSLYIYFV